MAVIGAQSAREVENQFKSYDIVDSLANSKSLTKIAQIQRLWCALLVRNHKDYPANKGLSAKERAQAKRLIEIFGSGRIGNSLKVILENWERYVALVQAKSHQAGQPTYPSLGYILKHAAVSRDVVPLLSDTDDSSDYGDLGSVAVKDY